jgi:hypothetical protein
MPEGPTMMRLPHDAPLELIARTLYRELVKSGFTVRDTIAVASHLLDHVAVSIRVHRNEDTARASAIATTHANANQGEL